MNLGSRTSCRALLYSAEPVQPVMSRSLGFHHRCVDDVGDPPARTGLDGVVQPFGASHLAGLVRPVTWLGL